MLSKNNRIVICFFLWLSLTAQKNSATLIQEDLNRIVATSLQEWNKDLKFLQEKNRKELTIFHMGGSHVQAGFWSHAFLKKFLQETNTALRGYYFFPYSTIRSNNPVFINTYASGRWKKCRSVLKELCLPLGPAGVSAYTRDSSVIIRISLNKKESLLSSFTHLQMLHQITGTVIITCSYPASTVIYSDSSETIIQFENPTDSAEIVIQVKDSLSLFRIYLMKIWKEDVTGILFGALGANGASTESMLRVSHMNNFMNKLHPDWIILSYGVNDVQGKYFSPDDFRKNYDTLMQRLQSSSSGKTKFLISGITDNYVRKKGYNKKTVKGCKDLEALCREKDISYWPLFEIMGGERSIQKWYKAGLAKRDRIHFNRKGYELIGTLMAEALLKKLNETQP